MTIGTVGDPLSTELDGPPFRFVDDEFRSNRRPIELIVSPACPRSQISDRRAAE
jgi:hypothetical protein